MKKAEAFSDKFILLNLKYKSSYVEKNEQDQYLFFQNKYNLEDLMIELKDKKD